ncbi:MAG: hypothetical protein HYY24_22020 [Verrucomicrobia bacterium]|nr:hypothetical protein [Verrucomicrobiota bacterium]
MSSARQTHATQPSSESWANLGLQQADAEIERIDQLEQRAAPIPPVAHAIRELITRFEICHFKMERHLERIIQAIGEMRLDFAPASIGRSHPKCGPAAWRTDRTGRGRQGQEYIWLLQMWLADEPFSAEDPRAIPRPLFEEVNRALGTRDAQKRRLVEALLDRLLLNPDRQPLPAELAGFRLQIEATDICHYAFPSNLKRMLEGIGRLEPVPDFLGCGSFGEAQRRVAEEHFHALRAWLQAGPSSLADRLGDRTPVKEWLAVCLAKTLKQLVGLHENLPLR